MKKLHILSLSGTPYEMGYQHGRVYYDAIHKFTSERVKLSMEPAWTGFTTPRDEVLELAEACVRAHIAYAPDLMEELRGMSDATGLTLAELIIMNGFTDFVDLVYAYNVQQKMPIAHHPSDNCTAFLIPGSRAADGHSFFGQTWDMHASATPFVILMDGKPDNGMRFLSFTTTGCVGMIGMNEAGIAVGINNLMGGDGQVGVTWNFIIRRVLQQDNIADALSCITDAPRAGAHNYILLDKHGTGYNIEAMGQRYEIQELQDTPIHHTNHCVIPQAKAVERKRPPASQADSEYRYSRAAELLQSDTITLDDLMEIT
ncbi:MAG TPA: C45 family peptidase, partial [Aggregatilineales bacterium]|nr:C45 family peptidase [Aggregatilineales bacterium]